MPHQMVPSTPTATMPVSDFGFHNHALQTSKLRITSNINVFVDRLSYLTDNYMQKSKNCGQHIGEPSITFQMGPTRGVDLSCRLRPRIETLKRSRRIPLPIRLRDFREPHKLSQCGLGWSPGCKCYFFNSTHEKHIW